MKTKRTARGKFTDKHFFVSNLAFRRYTRINKVCLTCGGSDGRLPCIKRRTPNE